MRVLKRIPVLCLLLLIIVLSRASLLSAGEWVYTYPQLGHSAHSCWLALDDMDNPVLIYEAPAELYYAWYDGSSWYEEVVDPRPQAGQNCKLLLDDEGSPHLIYCDTGEYNVRYAWHDGSEWHMEDVWDDLGLLFDMVLDDEGVPHVSFTNNSPPYDFHYAARSDTGWVVELAGYAGDWPNALALDSSGNPHIVASACTEIIHRWREEGIWEYESFYLLQFPHDLEMTIGPDDRISVLVQGSYDLVYAEKSDSVWETTVVDSVSGYGCDMELGENGVVHIAYEDMIDNDVRYARRDSTGWQVEVLNSDDFCGLTPSIELDAGGNPHVLHSMWGAVELISWVPDSLSIEQGEVSGDVFAEVSIEPNPVVSTASIGLRVSEPGEYAVSVYDLSGRQVMTLFEGYLASGEHSIQLDRSNLAAGVCFLRFSGPEGNSVRSFLVCEGLCQ